MADTLIKEVNSAMKADQWRALWQQFGKSVAWVTGAVLLLTVGYVWFDGVRQNFRQSVTGSLVSSHEALAAENTEKAVRMLEMSVQKGAPIGVSEASLRSLTLLQLAALPLHEDRDHQQHIATDITSLDEQFGDIVSHPNTDIALKQLWQLLQLHHAAQSDTPTLDDTIMRAPDSGPFAALIREQQAVLLAHAGNPADAHATIISLLENPQLAATQRARLDMLLSQIIDTQASSESAQ